MSTPSEPAPTTTNALRAAVERALLERLQRDVPKGSAQEIGLLAEALARVSPAPSGA